MVFLVDCMCQVRARENADVTPRVLVGATEYMVPRGKDPGQRVGCGTRSSCWHNTYEMLLIIQENLEFRGNICSRNFSWGVISIEAL